MTARPRRILLVTDKVPGHDNGYAIRVANVIEGLKAAGDLHVCLVDSSTGGTDLPVDDSYSSIVIPAQKPPRWAKAVRLRRLLPANVRYRYPARLRRELVGALSHRRFDVVWCSRAPVHVLTVGLFGGRRVVDFDDLNDRLLESEIRDRQERRGLLLTAPRSMRDFVDVRLWRRLQARITEQADRVVVCSSADQRYLATGNAAVVPNGYPEPEPAAENAGHRGARILFVGPLFYEPNRLAVEWFIADVLPLVQRRLPEAQLVVVGEREGIQVRGQSAPGVSLVGHVPDVAPYYAEASVAVTPLGSGGGTRLKCIEALARSVPLVSTTFGSYGLGLEPGRELLVADDADCFAEGCIAAMTDVDLRQRLVAAGRRRYRAEMTANETRSAICELVADLTSDLVDTDDPDCRIGDGVGIL